MAPAGALAGATEKLAQGRSEGGVAGIERVLCIADEMGEAALMVLLGPIHLGGEPVGDPKIGSVLAQKLFDHGPAAVGMNDEAGVLRVMEYPCPPSPLADPHGGLVRLQDGAGEQAGADQARSLREGLFAVREHVAGRAFADFGAGQIENRRESRSNEIAWVKRR